MHSQHIVVFTCTIRFGSMPWLSRSSSHHPILTHPTAQICSLSSEQFPTARKLIASPPNDQSRTRVSLTSMVNHNGHHLPPTHRSPNNAAPSGSVVNTSCTTILSREEAHPRKKPPPHRGAHVPVAASSQAPSIPPFIWTSREERSWERAHGRTRIPRHAATEPACLRPRGGGSFKVVAASARPSGVPACHKVRGRGRGKADARLPIPPPRRLSHDPTPGAQQE